MTCHRKLKPCESSKLNMMFLYEFERCQTLQVNMTCSQNKEPGDTLNINMMYIKKLEHYETWKINIAFFFHK